MPFLFSFFYKREQHREAWSNLACIYAFVSIQMQECKCQKCCMSEQQQDIVFTVFTLADSMQNQGQN